MSQLLVINHSLKTSGLFHYHFVQSVKQIGPSTSQFDLGFPYLLRKVDEHWIKCSSSRCHPQWKCSQLLFVVVLCDSLSTVLQVSVYRSTSVQKKPSWPLHLDGHYLAKVV